MRPEPTLTLVAGTPSCETTRAKQPVGRRRPHPNAAPSARQLEARQMILPGERLTDNGVEIFVAGVPVERSAQLG